jgi:hypothetical protein
MELIKRKIWLEDLISRKADGTYGTFTGDSFYVKIILTQNSDDMGVYNSLQHITLNGTPQFAFPISTMGVRNQTDTLERYKTDSYKLSGLTEDRLDEVKSYDSVDVYKEGFDVNREDYINYKGDNIEGRTRVTRFGEPMEYVIDANDDGKIGSLNQEDGLFLKTFNSQNRRVVINGETKFINRTEIYYNSQGWNDTNVGHSALTKEEYLFGITSEPKVFSDVFIDRGVLSPIERHLKLSEVKTLNNLINYGNGYFNVKK